MLNIRIIAYLPPLDALALLSGEDPIETSPTGARAGHGNHAGRSPVEQQHERTAPGAGSNGWNAAFRMRWWLEIIREDGDPTNKRKLHRMKVTGAHNDRKPIDLVVGEGGWLELVGGATARAEGGTLGEGLAKMEDDNQWFLDQLVEREAQGRPLAPGVKSPD